MYELALTTSHVPAQSDMETREITISALLREVAVARPPAWPDIVPDDTVMIQYTY